MSASVLDSKVSFWRIFVIALVTERAIAVQTF